MNTTVTNPKLLQIAKSPSLRKKIEILLILESAETIKDFFCISEEELQEYKTNFFDIDDLLKMGQAFIIEYLERRGDKEYLKCYLLGGEYAKGKLGVITDLIDKEKLLSKLISNFIVDSLDNKVTIAALKDLSKLLKENRNSASKESPIEITLNILRENGYDI